MTTKTLWTKLLGRIAPADQAAEDFLAHTKLGANFMAKTWRPRNPRHHKLLMALLQLVIDNSGKYPDIDTLLDSIKIGTGHAKIYPAVHSVTHCPHCGGEVAQSKVYVRPLSIAWESMDQDEFNPWFDRALALVCNRILVGTELEALRQEVERAAYGRYPS